VEENALEPGFLASGHPDLKEIFYDEQETNRIDDT